MKEMKTLKFPNQEEAYEIVDAHAREQVGLKQSKITGTAGQVVGFDASGNAVAQSAPSSASRQTVTLTTVGWTAGSGYAYQQTVTLSGVTANTDFDVDVNLSGTDAEADALILEAFGLVTFADSVSGGIKFACPSEKPGVNIPINIRIYG